MNDSETLTDRSAELKVLLGDFIYQVMRYDTVEVLRLIQREDLSMPRIVALNLVERRGAVSISDISTYVDLSLGNTSMLVDKLVCKGFVTRAEDANDRRHKVVRLTDKGRALIQELRTTRAASIAQRMLLLPPELLDSAIDVLRKITEQLPDISVDVNRS